MANSVGNLTVDVYSWRRGALGRLRAPDWAVFHVRLSTSQPTSGSLSTNLARGDQFAVDIFFVLSGYIMIVAYGTRVDAPTFFLHRFARVFPLHIVVLAFAITGFYLLQYQALQPEAYSLENLIFYLSLTFVWVGLAARVEPTVLVAER